MSDADAPRLAAHLYAALARRTFILADMTIDIGSFNGNNEPWTIEDSGKHQQSADYEEAIRKTGYGLFNILMLLAALPVGWTCVLDTTITAFFIQSTECYFELTLFRRGIAVGIVYIGMIIAGPLWDFVFRDCIIIYYGKRNVIIIGLFLDSICNIFWAHATSFYSFIICKFFNGILIAGPLSLLMPYLSEFHAPMYQPTFTKWASLLFVISSIFPPALASVLILNESSFNFTIFNRFYATWRVYMLICTIPSVLGVLTVFLMPKSPKFLLTQGQSHEALRVFQTMYSMNKFQSSNRFKFTTLIAQQKVHSNNIRNMCKENLQDSVVKLKMLCSKPHLKTFLTILLIQFTSMLGFNTMRLWVPQLFITLNNFRVLLWSFYPVDETITMCEMLFPRIEKIDSASCNYTLPDVESAVYVNATIITSSAVLFSFLFTVMADTKMKKEIVIVMAFLISTICSFGANWAIEIPYILILCSFITVTSRIAGNIIITYNAEVTPQVLRPTATNSMNFVGNVGAAVGSIVFSVVLGANCLTAFISIGCLTLFSYVMSFFLLKQPVEPIKLDLERY